MGRSLQRGKDDDTVGPRAAVLGQHDRCVLHQQDGGDTLAAPLLGGVGTLGHGVVQRVLGVSGMAVKK